MIYKKLSEIQSKIKVPKTQYNSFGKYNYRSLEDIFEEVKKYLDEYKLSLYLSDEIVLIGDRYYVKSTAILVDVEDGAKIESIAYAREEENKKGMDGSQITGASSSYARKYALGSLFLLDDNKDSDYTNTHDKNDKPILTEDKIDKAVEYMKEKKISINELKKKYTISKDIEDKILSLLKN
jgi:hypothetical protein